MMLKWTRDCPTVRGWYWARQPSGAVLHVEVHNGVNGWEAIDDIDHLGLDQFVAWYGPLSPPPYDLED